MKIIIIADTVIGGQHIEAGPDVIEVDEPTGNLLLSAFKAARYVSPAVPTVDEAKQELIEKIEAATSAEDLEALLSEDPDIVAAYEKKIQELEAA